jgi:hypothetical protein
MSAPGERVRALASRLLASESMERIVDPILADLQFEHAEALARGSRWAARVNLIRSYAGLGRALFYLATRAACDPRLANPRCELARAWMVSALALAFLTVALVLPALTSLPWRKGDGAFAAALSVTLVPQALPLSLPAALSVGVLWATRGRRVTGVRFCVVLPLALACTAGVWAVLEWVMPDANQGFRELAAARLNGGPVVRLERGLAELGLSSLAQRSDPAAVRQYHLLWALCFAAVPLSLCAVGLAGYVRRGISAAALAIALTVSYTACIGAVQSVGSTVSVSPVVHAWLPNMLFMLSAIVLLLRAASSEGSALAYRPPA